MFLFTRVPFWVPIFDPQPIQVVLNGSDWWFEDLNPGFSCRMENTPGNSSKSPIHTTNQRLSNVDPGSK